MLGIFYWPFWFFLSRDIRLSSILTEAERLVQNKEPIHENRKAELDLHSAWTPLPWRRGQWWRPRVHRARYAYMLALLIIIHQCHHFTLLIYILILHPQAHQREIKIERGSPATPSSPKTIDQREIKIERGSPATPSSPKTIANPAAAGVLQSKGST
jgi:hypothetical protein